MYWLLQYRISNSCVYPIETFLQSRTATRIAPLGGILDTPQFPTQYNSKYIYVNGSSDSLFIPYDNFYTLQKIVLAMFQKIYIIFPIV